MKSNDLWKAVNTTLGKNSVDPLMHLYTQFQDSESAATAINDALTNVFTKSGPSPLIVGRPDWIPLIQTNEVLKMLLAIKPSKASPDLPCLLYKAAANQISKPLTHLFNRSIRETRVPMVWKTAAIVPVPKCATPKVDDIRPISLIPIPAKLLERLVLNSVKSALLANYGPYQLGFRPNSSTECALICLNDHVTKYSDRKDIAGVQVVTYDYSKAFDKLKSDTILNRLQWCSLPTQFLKWLTSYLEARQQFVKVGCSLSSLSPVTSGVPQGSILGPYLFSVVSGEFTSTHEDSCLIKFADDSTSCFPLYKNEANNYIILQHNRLLAWSTDVGLSLNIKKCKSLLIPSSRNCNSVKLSGVTEVDSLKLLGVWINWNLTWTKHIDNVVSTTSRRFFALRTLRPYMNKTDMKTIYFALIRTILNYCGSVFVGLTARDEARLVRIQNRFHHLLCGWDCRQNCLPPLREFRENRAKKLLTKAEQPDHILHDILLYKSNSGRFVLPIINTNRRLNSFVPYVSILLNNTHTR